MKALVLSVPASEVELASDVLWSLGVLAVEERGGGPDTADHLVELWTSLGDDVEAVAHAAEGFPARWRWRLEDVDDTVVDTWRSHATPTWVESDLVVCPSWVPFEPPDVPGGLTVVHIEPGVTFGLGDHPTTVLSLRALRASLFPGATVLDVGCGSGVLAIAACKLGAARADAVDIAVPAIRATNENAIRNGVAAQVSVSLRPLHEVPDQYDVVVANILAPALVSLAPELRRVLAPAGVLVISGVLAGAHDHVLAALAPLRVIDTSTKDGWAAVTLRR